MKRKKRRKAPGTGFMDLDAEEGFREYLDDDWEEKDYYEGETVQEAAGEGIDDLDGKNEGGGSEGNGYSGEEAWEGYLDEEEEEDEDIKARYLGKKYGEKTELGNRCDGKAELGNLETDYMEGIEIEYLEASETGYLDEEEDPETGYLDREEDPETDYLDEEENEYFGTGYLNGKENRVYEIDYREKKQAEGDYIGGEENGGQGTGCLDGEEDKSHGADGKEREEIDYLDEDDEEASGNGYLDGKIHEKGDSAYPEAEPSEKEGNVCLEGGTGKEKGGGYPAEGYLDDDGYGEEDDYIEEGYGAAESSWTEERAAEHMGEDISEDGISENNEGGGIMYAAGDRKKAADWKRRHIRKSRQAKEYRAARKRKGFHYRIKYIDAADHIMAAAGVLLLAGSIIMGSIYANERAEAAQVASFSEIGTQMEGIAVIGESGLLAMTDAQNVKAAVAEAEAAEEAAAVKVYEEKELYEEGSIEVEMHLSSVQRDLKIKFINKETGRLISNVPFEVTVVGADKKSYVLKDEDMDGIIYQADAEPGKCSVAMMEAGYAQEYAISTGSVPVTVRDTIEYKKVDVTDEIKKESEVNTAAEDTKRALAAESSLTDTVGFVASTVEVTEKAVGEQSASDGGSQAEGKAGTENVPGAEESSGSDTEGESSAGEGSGTTENSGYEEVPKENIADPAAAFSDNSSQGNNGQDDSAEGREGGGEEQAAPEVALNRADIKLLTNHTVQLSANVKGMEDKSVTWVSDNSAVAAVASDGTVTGVSEGTATVTVTCNGDNSITASCAVAVQTDPASDYNTKLSDKDGNALYVMNSDGTFREAFYADYYTADKFYRAVQKGQEQEGQAGQNQEQGNQSQESQDNQGQEQGNQPQESQDNQGQGNQSQDSQSQGQGGQSQESQDNQNQGQGGQPQDSQAGQSQGQGSQSQEGQATEGQGGQTTEGNGEGGPEQPAEVAEEYKYTGWQTIDGKTYYFDADGNKVTGEQVIQGAKYTFGQDGVLSAASGHMGIDVSRWNGKIDWNAVKNSGVSYVIIRCGYRGSTTGALIEDSMFQSNIQGAASAGLKVGVYFVTQAVSEVEAVEEASMVISLLSSRSLSYPVFLDVEPSGGRGDGISRETRTAVCTAFCQTIANSGYSAGIYANSTWLTEKMDAPGLSNYKIWLAQYAAQPSYKATRYDMWQYSAKGKIAGISGDTDLNISYLGY